MRFQKSGKHTSASICMLRNYTIQALLFIFMDYLAGKFQGLLYIKCVCTLEKGVNMSSIRSLWVRWRNEGCLAVFWSVVFSSWLITHKVHEWFWGKVTTEGDSYYHNFCPILNSLNIIAKEWIKTHKISNLPSDLNPRTTANVVTDSIKFKVIFIKFNLELKPKDIDKVLHFGFKMQLGRNPRENISISVYHKLNVVV